MGVVYLAITVAVVMIVAIVGAVVINKTENKPSTEMSDADVRRYREAAKILNSLVNITDIEGPFGADVLSDETRKTINAWLYDYKKGIRQK